MRESLFFYDFVKGGGCFIKVFSFLILGCKELKFLRVFFYYVCSDLCWVLVWLLFVMYVSSCKFG